MSIVVALDSSIVSLSANAKLAPATQKQISVPSYYFQLITPSLPPNADIPIATATSSTVAWHPMGVCSFVAWHASHLTGRQWGWHQKVHGPRYHQALIRLRLPKNVLYDVLPRINVLLPCYHTYI
jgi:hypothetical protein